MIGNLISYLDSSGVESIQLYFVIRRKNARSSEISYSILKAIISQHIGEELKEIGKTQLEDLRERCVQYINYGALLTSDQDFIEIITVAEVPHLLQLINDSGESDLELINYEQFEKVWGYMLKIEKHNKCLILLKKSNASRLLKKDTKAYFFRDGQFDSLESHIITLERDFDAALLIETELDGEQEVLILNRTLFEAFFSFNEIYEKEVMDRIEIIEGKSLFDNTSSLIEICKKDARKIRKLAKAVKSQYFESINLANIGTSTTNYHLEIVFAGDGKIRVVDSNIWAILRLLDDDCVSSEVTGNKYLAHSKMIV